MNNIIIPKEYNYIGIFLTYNCNLNCSYCINKYNSFPNKRAPKLDWKQWIKCLNRIESRPDLPLTIQGGEPTMHPNFYEIINGIKPELNIDLLTNAQFDIDKFMSKIDKDRMKRDSKYASIRISFHPEQMSLLDTIYRVRALQDKGYSVGVWLLDVPTEEKWTAISAGLFREKEIDCRTKEYLGFYEGVLRGTYKYLHAMNALPKRCLCKPSEMLIDPCGRVYRCHSDLYSGCDSYTHMLDNPKLINTHKSCTHMGVCNPCDIKLKTNRYQEDGHCSVDIIE